MRRRSAKIMEPLLRSFVLLLFLFTSAAAQNKDPQLPSNANLVLENEFVRVLRVTIPTGGDFSLVEKNDTVTVRLQDEVARFSAKGDRVAETNSTEHDAVALLVELKKHWDVPVRPCSLPKKCTRETMMGDEPIAWTTTLFTNGFITATTHKVVRGGTLTSSYYTSKGPDRIVLVPFTDLNVNFSGLEENLKAGQPYFGTGSEVEVTAKNSESRWFVLRFSSAEK